MSDVFKYLGIAVAVILADALLCLFFTFLWDDNDKWLPTLVVNCLGFVACLTIMIGKVVG